MSKHFKVVLVGDGSVGKTCFIKRFLQNTFTESYVPTLGVDIWAINFRTNYGNYTIDFWDTAGQEKFGGLRTGYYLQAKGFIIMCDLSNEKSCNNEKWDQLIKENVLKVIVGNKNDIKQVIVNPQYPYFETSCKYIKSRYCLSSKEFNW
jgi:GTP-binding nuclear protein Ran